MNDRRVARLLGDITELLDRAAVVLPERLRDMSDASMAWPPGRGFDSAAGSGFTNVTFCEVHERQFCPCGQGTPYPAVADRTGEAATQPDRAAADRAALVDALRSMGRDAARVVRILERYTPRAATDGERRATLAVNERDESCRSCARIGSWSPSHRRVEVPSGGQVWVCRWCYDWAREQGEAPSPSVLALHHQGKTVRRPVRRGGAA